jgi:hypothetical protein
VDGRDKPGHDEKKHLDPISSARSCFGLALPVFLRAFCGPDSALDKIYFN